MQNNRHTKMKNVIFEENKNVEMQRLQFDKSNSLANLKQGEAI